MKRILSYDALEEFGRVRLSTSFFMRDFLHSEIAAWHGMRNVPDYPDRAIEVGRKLCENLLEPLQETFGRLHIRSGYRSPTVNDHGNKNKLNCASNESNYAAHIWDHPDSNGRSGATACVVLPWLVDHIACGGKWTDLAWWIHDHLPYNSMCFFPKLTAFNINWRESPEKRIDSYADPKGCLTRPGMPNHSGLHTSEYHGFPELGGTRRIAASALRVRPSAPAPAPRTVVLPTSSLAATTPRHAEALAPPKRAQNAEGGRIWYRAVHTKTRWRKVNSPHASMNSALFGKDGAAGLFARKVRIDYDKHGEPLYVAVWQDGAARGFIVKADGLAANGIRVLEVATEMLEQFEHTRDCAPETLEQLFYA